MKKGIRKIWIAGLCAASLTGFGQSVGDANGLSVMGPGSSGDRTFDPGDEVHLVPDPLRPVNKAFQAVSEPIYEYVGIPLAKGWRWLAPACVRRSINRFSSNWSYPVRLVSLGLQGEGRGAWQETKRFGINTTVGVLGLMDPATSKGIRAQNEDIGQAFGSWGVGHGAYLFVPVLGPSSVRDGAGRVGDYLLNPATYIPGLGAFFSFNELSFKIDGYEAITESGVVSLYDPLRALWAVQREVLVENYTIPESSYETADADLSIGSVWLAKADNSFIRSARERRVVSPATGRKVPYSAWIQDEPSPLIYLIPGIGSHRNSTMAAYLAELLYKEGCSVVTISSPFHPEFMRTGLSAVFPGYTPSDSSDLYQAMTVIDEALEKKFPGRFTDRRLSGYSLGALATGFIADMNAKSEEPAIPFSRYALINPPVDLFTSVEGFETYYKAYKQWPEAEREDEFHELAKKCFVFAQNPGKPGSVIPMTRTESEVLIGLSVRATLLEAVNTGQMRDEYVGETHLLALKDINLISTYFFADQFVGPYYGQTAGMTMEQMQKQVSLTHVQKTIAESDNVRVMTNEDDFIIDEEGLQWLRDNAKDRLTVFPSGGHLGNLWQEKVQKQILKDLVY